ncbi:MAG TPA: DEAD/DEAH box helicase [Candidatus Korarchaeota archaeon]|nr:DEAD/DEAH box helicase [Candidatus Korarchaeota archaeon]
MPLDSSKILARLGYDFYSFKEPAERPERVDKTFQDLLPKLSVGGPLSRRIASMKLYKHQQEAIEALERGENVILISGAGSGKTEAWFVHAAKAGVRTLVVYPTLALANDQVRRLEDYCESLGIKVMPIDAMRRDQLRSTLGTSGLRSALSQADIIVTNPAFLLNDLKRWVSKGALLRQYCLRLSLLVLDELDFYGPRELALLISMIRLMTLLTGRKFQIAILTATLGNPSELATALTEINGRATRVIRGRPFRAENRVYVVLGKNLKAIWESLRDRRDELESAGVGEDILEALEYFDEFKVSAFKVIEAAKWAGIQVPSPAVDPSEIIAEYARDEGVTLVFTRSIRYAEELRRRASLELGEMSEKVAAHHHLVPKQERVEIERGAREGEVTVLISPRTLAQGIDIGGVIRVVHVGLPPTVREFRQREGRKGRREEIEFTESIILPLSSWDRELLMRGAETLRSWVELPLEKALVNPKNKYSTLFEGLFKAVSPELRQFLTEDEVSLLKELGLIEPGGLTEKGKRTWSYMNFYEFGPPYGMKRLLVEEAEQRYLEDIGHCDLVERFQPGCIDYSANAIVVDLLKRGRIITGVVEKPLSARTVLSYDPLAHAYEEYARVKMSWGEEPDVVGDYYRGRLHSEVVCVVDPPRRGFDLLVKTPNRVYWVLRSGKYRPVISGDRTYFVVERRSLPVIGPTGGRYRDYTYGVTVELEPGEDLEWMRVGLALLMVVLRLRMGIELESITYSLSNVGDRKIMSLHEPESAGLLETLDWMRVLKEVDSFEPDDIADVLLEQIDEQARLTLLSSGARWDLAKAWARRAVEYILLRESILLRVAGRQVPVPVPSRALRLVSFEVITLPVGEQVVLTASAIYDGENTVSEIAWREFFQSSGWEKVPATLGSLIDEGFSVIVYDSGSILRSLQEAGSTALYLLLEGLRQKGRLLELLPLAKEVLELDIATLESLVEAVGWQKTISLDDVKRELEKSTAILQERGEASWRRFTKYLRAKSEAYARENAEVLLTLYLALQSLRNE